MEKTLYIYAQMASVKSINQLLRCPDLPNWAKCRRRLTTLVNDNLIWKIKLIGCVDGEAPIIGLVGAWRLAQYARHALAYVMALLLIIKMPIAVWHIVHIVRLALICRAFKRFAI